MSIEPTLATQRMLPCSKITKINLRLFNQRWFAPSYGGNARPLPQIGEENDSDRGGSWGGIP